MGVPPIGIPRAWGVSREDRQKLTTAESKMQNKHQSTFSQSFTEENP